MNFSTRLATSLAAGLAITALLGAFAVNRPAAVHADAHKVASAELSAIRIVSAAARAARTRAIAAGFP
jgi:hypothetical protein